MMQEDCIHLGYFDPTDRHVPNPGMGQIGYVFSDHQHCALNRNSWVWTETHDNNRPMDRKSFEDMLKLPYVDILYLRVEWCDVHKAPGKLELTKEFEWVLEAVEKYGKRWAFRIMNSSPHSRFETSVPAFLLDRMEYETYWHNHVQIPPFPKKYPKYTEEYFKWWEECVNLAADRFDKHPLLEFSEIAGFGHWAEAHHYGSYTGVNGPIFNKDPEHVEEVVDRVITSHLNAFTQTPSVMNIHFTEYEAGMKWLKSGKVWVRRDSFQSGFSTHEWDNITTLPKGNAMLWEPLMPTGLRTTTPAMDPMQLVYRYTDSGASYSSLGFNAWDAKLLHQLSVPQVRYLAENLGYKLRPSIVWRRFLSEEEQEITLAMVNDGCATPAGELTMIATFPSGQQVRTTLPKGEPAPGAKPLVRFAVPKQDLGSTSEEFVKIRAELKLKEKRYPVQFATKQTLIDPYEIELPMFVRQDIGREVILPGTNASGCFISYDRRGERVTDPKRKLNF